MSQNAERHSAEGSLDFLVGDGEMGRRTREHDWSQTPLGPPEHCPQSLKTALAIILTTRYPMLIWWGPQLLHFYNDAYIPMLGLRHPAALGRPAPEVWSDAWPRVGCSQAEAVMNEGRSYWNEELLLVIEEEVEKFKFGVSIPLP